MIILKFLFIIILTLLLLAVVAVIVVAKIFHGIHKGFKNMQNSTYDSAQNRTDNNNGGQDVIVDRRSPEEANRKIIAEDEGEYIDFEESKD